MCIRDSKETLAKLPPEKRIFFNGTWEAFGPEDNPHNEHAEA